MREFDEVLAGARGRTEARRELAAWAVSHLMNATGNMRQPVTIDQLLGPEWTLRRIQAEAKTKRQEESN